MSQKERILHVSSAEECHSVNGNLQHSYTKAHGPSSVTGVVCEASVSCHLFFNSWWIPCS